MTMVNDSNMTEHPIRYYKLENHGAAVIHFLVKDSADGNTVFEGGPTLSAGQHDMIDLSQTKDDEIKDKESYCFGAYVTGGKNNTDKKPHPVDFNSKKIGVWKWTGTTLSSKMHFIGYEDKA